MPMAMDPSQLAQWNAQVEQLRAGIQDLANQFDYLGAKVENINLADKLGSDRALGNLRDLRNLVSDTTLRYKELTLAVKDLSRAYGDAIQRKRNLENELRLLEKKDKLGKADEKRRAVLRRDEKQKEASFKKELSVLKQLTVARKNVAHSTAVGDPAKTPSVAAMNANPAATRGISSFFSAMIPKLSSAVKYGMGKMFGQVRGAKISAAVDSGLGKAFGFTKATAPKVRSAVKAGIGRVFGRTPPIAAAAPGAPGPKTSPGGGGKGGGPRGPDFDVNGKGINFFPTSVGGMVRMLLSRTGPMGKAVIAFVDIFREAGRQLERVMRGIITWQDKLRNSLAQLARRLGTTTTNVIELHTAAKQSFLEPGGLGDLGYNIGDITGMLGDFAEQMEYTDKITGKQAASLIKMGLGVGMNAQQVGELTRSLVVMGQGAESAEKFMQELRINAAAAGVTAKSLSKQFQGAGKVLFELTGPSAHRRLIQTAAYLAKIGTGLDKLKGFVDMTDTFDATVEAAAKVNTVFGTTINGLELFAEQDIGKRAAMLVDHLRYAGVNIENMTRAEKKFMAEQFKVDEQTLNALLAAASGNKDITAELEKQREIEEKKAKTDAQFAESMYLAKDVLITISQITSRIWEAWTKLMEPLFRGFGYFTGLSLTVDEIKNGMTIFDKVINRVSKAFGILLEKMKLRGVDEKLAQVGEVFGDMFNKLMEWIESDAAAEFFISLIDTFKGIARIIDVLILPVIEEATNLVGMVLGAINQIRGLGTPDATPPHLKGQGKSKEEVAAARKAALGVTSNIPTVTTGDTSKNGIAKTVQQKAEEQERKQKSEDEQKTKTSRNWGMALGAAAVAPLAAPFAMVPGLGWVPAAAIEGAGMFVGGSTGELLYSTKENSSKILEASEEAQAAGVFSQEVPEARAAGGPVAKGSPYWVGEQGLPELFTPGQSGKITNLQDILSQATAQMDLQPIQVQVFLDSEKIQDSMYKRNYRSIS